MRILKGHRRPELKHIQLALLRIAMSFHSDEEENVLRDDVPAHLAALSGSSSEAPAAAARTCLTVCRLHIPKIELARVHLKRVQDNLQQNQVWHSMPLQATSKAWLRAEWAGSMHASRSNFRCKWECGDSASVVGGHNLHNVSEAQRR